MWVAQDRNHFKYFKPLGWGVAMQRKPKFGPGDDWVHIAVPIPSWLNSTPLKVNLVYFCGRSSNGASTYPKYVDLWAEDQRFFTGGITWGANSSRQCIPAYPASAIRYSVGISVLIHFGSTSDEFTMEEAWAKLSD